MSLPVAVAAALGLALPAQVAAGASETIDMSWLAARFDHIGRFDWWVCPLEDDELLPVVAECSEPWDFNVAFGCRP